jgi:L-alanine-DL-glutamate epimerase-like enolase superfamily enzyme
MTITRVRAYLPPNPNLLFNQSDMVVTIETDTGIMGVGEGGSKDLLEQAAGRLIGRDPQHIEQLWQDMNRAFFYPAGRERTDAVGALDLALWDIKGKVQNQPIHELLGGMVRNYCECYNTAGIIPSITLGMPIKERARATVEAGYRAFRFGAIDCRVITASSTPKSESITSPKNAQQREKASAKTATRSSIFISASTFRTPPGAVTKIESLAPFFVEDPVRTEPVGVQSARRRRSDNVPGNESIRRTLVSHARPWKGQRHHLRWNWCWIRPYPAHRYRNCRALRLARVFLVQRRRWTRRGNRMVSPGQRYTGTAPPGSGLRACPNS